MATVTLGSNANNSLTALKFVPGVNGMAAADVASIDNLIRTDFTGILYLPGGRGIIQAKPGDYIGVDNKGWPIIVSAYSIANAAWTHT
jgi:hypothetical protein